MSAEQCAKNAHTEEGNSMKYKKIKAFITITFIGLAALFAGVFSVISVYRILTQEVTPPFNSSGAMYYATNPQIVPEGIQSELLFDREMYNTGNIEFDGYCFTPHDPGVYMVTLQYVRMYLVADSEPAEGLGTAWVLIQDTEGNAWNIESQIVHLDLPDYRNDFGPYGIRQVDAGVSVCAFAGQWGSPNMHVYEFAKFGIERVR